MMLLMDSLLPAVALLGRGFKEFAGTSECFVAARGVRASTGATPAFVAVSRHKRLFLAPVVATGVAPVGIGEIIYEFVNRRGQNGHMKPQGGEIARDRVHNNRKAAIEPTMRTIHIEVPESVLVGSGQTREAFVAEAKLLLALKLFELGRLSSGRAADISGMNRIDFLLRAGQSGTPVTDLDERAAGEFSWGHWRAAGYSEDR